MISCRVPKDNLNIPQPPSPQTVIDILLSSMADCRRLYPMYWSSYALPHNSECSVARVWCVARIPCVMHKITASLRSCDGQYTFPTRRGSVRVYARENGEITARYCCLGCLHTRPKADGSRKKRGATTTKLLRNKMSITRNSPVLSVCAYLMCSRMRMVQSWIPGLANYITHITLACS